MVKDHFDDVELEMVWQGSILDQIDMFLGLLKGKGRIGALWQVMIIERPVLEAEIRALQAEWTSARPRPGEPPAALALPHERLTELKSVAQDVHAASLRGWPTDTRFAGARFRGARYAGARNPGALLAAARSIGREPPGTGGRTFANTSERRVASSR